MCKVWVVCDTKHDKKYKIFDILFPCDTQKTCLFYNISIRKYLHIFV